MNYQEAITYIHNLSWNGKGSGIERTKELLIRCGRPERSLKVIHIAGTNGKGSTAAMLSSVFQAAGYKTGLYTSPYIVRYNERIQMDGAEIPDEELAALTEELSCFVPEMSCPPNEFEFGTALAFLYFARKHCEYVVLETGLGGLLDPTNIIEKPLLCIITALGFDHTALLGKTMQEISAAKAGIIKQDVPVVFYGEDDTALTVIEKRCRELSAKLTVPDFSKLIVIENGSFSEDGSNGFHQRFSYRGFPEITLSLPGLYQQKNTAVVLEAVFALRKEGVLLPDRAVVEGLSSVQWPARLETLFHSPLILADGSHNPQGMRATMESLTAYFPGRELTFVFGVMEDKELSAMLPLFLPHAKKVIVTEPELKRAMKAEKLLGRIKEVCKKETVLVLCPNVSDAVSLAKKEPKDEVVVIIGSLFLVGEAKRVGKF